MCLPCSNARRAMEHAASKDPVAKKALATLKLEDNEAW